MTIPTPRFWFEEGTKSEGAKSLKAERLKTGRIYTLV
jgi:hypothetical protein